MDGLWYMHVFRAHRTSTIFPIEGGLDGLSLRVSNEGLQRPRVARAQIYMLLPSLLVSFYGGGLADPQMRASNEGLRRPRVARAQKINSLHPLFL